MARSGTVRTFGNCVSVCFSICVVVPYKSVEAERGRFALLDDLCFPRLHSVLIAPLCEYFSASMSADFCRAWCQWGYHEGRQALRSVKTCQLRMLAISTEWEFTIWRMVFGYDDVTTGPTASSPLLFVQLLPLGHLHFRLYGVYSTVSRGDLWCG